MSHSISNKVDLVTVVRLKDQGRRPILSDILNHRFCRVKTRFRADKVDKCYILISSKANIYLLGSLKLILKINSTLVKGDLRVT